MKQCAPSAVRQSHLYASQNNPFTSETAIIQEPNLKNFQMALLAIETNAVLVPVVACWHDLVKREMGSNFCLFDLVTCFKGVWRNRSYFVTVFPVIMLSTILHFTSLNIQPASFKTPAQKNKGLTGTIYQSPISSALLLWDILF